MENNNLSDDNLQSQAFISLPVVDTTFFKNLHICFCIDVSGSTSNIFADGKKIVQVEIDFVKSFLPYLTKPPKFITWETNAHAIVNLDMVRPNGGTSPDCLFRNVDTFKIIHDTEVMVIITDGEIGVGAINSFGKYMTSMGTHLKAVIGVIVGRRTNATKNTIKTPADIDVSVLVPAMISNSCILFHNWKNTYVMWSSGIFKNELNPHDITDESVWLDITNVDPNKIINIKIPIVDSSLESNLRDKGYIPFGLGLFFNPNHLLASNPSWDDLLLMPFDRICQYFKITLCYDKLLKWFNFQKDKFIQEFIIDPNEKENIEKLIKEITNHNSNRTIDQSITSTYIKKRNTILAYLYMDVDDIEGVSDNPRIVQLLQFFCQMIKVMEEDNHIQHEANTYTTYTISSSRYSIFTKNSTTSGLSKYYGKMSTITANFDEPLKWLEQFSHLYPNHNSLKYECSICFEQSVPFVLIRKHIDKNNMNDFINNATNYFYPEILCCKCSAYFCSEHIDPVRVTCLAALPIVSLVGDSMTNYLSSFMKITNYDQQLCSSISKNIGQTSNFGEQSNAESKGFLIMASLFYGILRQHFVSVPDIILLLDQVPDF
jgi:hypothetical protein